MPHAINKIWIVLVVVLLCACSSSKEKIEGPRISVLEPQNDSDGLKLSSEHIEILPAQTNQSWTQNAFNAVHLQQNLIVAPEMNFYASFKAGKGASKKAPLISVPVVDNHIVYTQDRTGKVYAYDLKTKERLFKKSLKPSNKKESYDDMNGIGLALHEKYLFALTGFGSVFALDKSNGDILWQQDVHVPLRTAPSVAGNMLFIQTITNKLLVLDITDGHTIWTYDISSEDTVLAGGATPAYDQKNEIVVVAFSNGEIQAFDAKLGYEIWRNNLMDTSFSSTLLINAVKASPVIENNTVFAVGNNNRTMAIDLQSGDVLWTRPIGGVNTPFVSKTALFLLSNDGQLHALDKETGREIWAQTVLKDLKPKKRKGIYLSGPLMVNSKLLVTASNGMVYTFDPQTGSQTGSFNIDEDLPFGPVVADQKMIFLSSDAELIVYQ